jgi:hypothetical protein
MTTAAISDAEKVTERELAEQLAALPAESRERIESHVKLNAPIDEVDPAPTAAITKALIDDAEDAWTADANMARVEITGSCGLFWKEQGTHVFAPRESGKTTGLLVICCNMAAAGTKVLYLDRENGAAALKEKLDDILAANEWDAATVRENLTVRSWPMFDKEWDAEVYGDAIAAAGFDVVIYDSLRELFDQFGLDDNGKGDWSKLWSRLGSPLMRRGIVPVFLDNTGHKNKHRASGTAGKGDTLQQGYRFKTVSRFSRESTGMLEIKCTRSRLGHHGLRWQMTLGGGVYELPSTDMEAANTDEDKVLATVTTDYQRAAALADLLGMSYKTFMRHVEHINSDEEHDADDEDYEDFTPPILVQGGGKTKAPVEVALRADTRLSC